MQEKIEKLPGPLSSCEVIAEKMWKTFSNNASPGKHPQPASILIAKSEASLFYSKSTKNAMEIDKELYIRTISIKT